MDKINLENWQIQFGQQFPDPILIDGYVKDALGEQVPIYIHYRSNLEIFIKTLLLQKNHQKDLQFFEW